VAITSLIAGGASGAVVCLGSAPFELVKVSYHFRRRDGPKLRDIADMSGSASAGIPDLPRHPS
jgi:hypothetical protein